MVDDATALNRIQRALTGMLLDEFGERETLGEIACVVEETGRRLLDDFGAPANDNRLVWIQGSPTIQPDAH